MPTIGTLLLTYVLGGITFIPLLLGLLLCHAYYFLPVPQADSAENVLRERIQLLAEKEETWQEDLAALPPEVQARNREPDVAAGYFAVCREYVPGGVNGKPPERTTPAGAIISVESPSVYQSMYRSLFDRGKAQGPTIESSNGNPKATKKARNVFYVVLRLGHLMLYDDAEQLDVRHVLSLSLYNIDIFAGGDHVPEGELWVKRNCIRLTWRPTSDNIAHDSKPFYLFSDNCSDKEDFYHALLQNQDRVGEEASIAPVPLGFETAHIVKLVQQLHASEENMQTRWINALIGRLFLSLYKTADLQNLIHSKITKKISRVPKPTFIESINVKHIDLGDSAPLLTNPKLRELTIDGDMTIECDIKYKGNLRLEIAAVARIDLGPRFKARRVDLLLAGICKALEGHILIRVKPPPSNRIWFTFDAMPKIDLSIEPIVSSRQITYGIILRAIESRIREVIGDTLVLPNWDDIPFSNTSGFDVRGGIWSEQAVLKEQMLTPEIALEEQGDSVSNVADLVEKSPSAPALVGHRRTSLSSYSNESPSSSFQDLPSSGKSTSIEVMDEPSKPRNMRSNSFVTAASVSLDPATVQAIKLSSEASKNNATKVMKDITSRSHPASPSESPVGSPAAESDSIRDGKRSAEFSYPPSDLSFSASSDISGMGESPSRGDYSAESTHSVEGAPHERSLSKSSTTSSLKRQSIAANAASATAMATRWLAKHSNTTPTPLNPKPDHADHSGSRPDGPTYTDNRSDQANQPIGRGHPLPPPGQPLPGPPKTNLSWTTALSGLTKRKPLPVTAKKSNVIGTTSPTRPSPPPLPQRPQNTSGEIGGTPGSTIQPVSGSALPRRKIRASSTDTTASDVRSSSADDVLVIEAPALLPSSALASDDSRMPSDALVRDSHGQNKILADAATSDSSISPDSDDTTEDHSIPESDTEVISLNGGVGPKASRG